MCCICIKNNAVAYNSFCIFFKHKGESTFPNIFYGHTLFVIFPLQRSCSYLYLITFLILDLLIVSNKNMISVYLRNKTQYNSLQFNFFSSKWRTIKNLKSSVQTHSIKKPYIVKRNNSITGK